MDFLAKQKACATGGANTFGATASPCAPATSGAPENGLDITDHIQLDFDDLTAAAMHGKDKVSKYIITVVIKQLTPTTAELGSQSSLLHAPSKPSSWLTLASSQEAGTRSLRQEDPPHCCPNSAVQSSRHKKQTSTAYDAIMQRLSEQGLHVDQ